MRYHLTVHNMYGIMNDMCEQCGKHALNFLICGAMSPFDSIGVFFLHPNNGNCRFDMINLDNLELLVIGFTTYLDCVSTC